RLCLTPGSAVVTSPTEQVPEAGGELQRARVDLVRVLLDAEGRTGPVGAGGGRALGSLALLLGTLGGVAGLALLLAGRRRHAALRLLATTGQPTHAGHASHPGHAAATAAACHRPHHRLRLGEALQQPVDVGGGDAGPAGDAGAARAVDDL